MLTATAVSDWLHGLGFSVPVMPGPRPEGKEPITPDVIAVITPAGGGPPMLDGVFDEPAYQVAVRGPQSRAFTEKAYAAAWEADRLIRFALPGYIGNTWCPSAIRFSGPPTLVGPSPDHAERITYTATYVFTAHAL
jgi:hypothetical protein